MKFVVFIRALARALLCLVVLLNIHVDSAGANDFVNGFQQIN